MIYLDNAATTLRKPPEVIEAVAHAMETVGNGARGAHGSALGAARTVYGARERVAQLFGLGDPSHVIFTCNATEALNIALFGLLGPGDHVISTDLEHNSVLRPLYALEEQGMAVDFVPADRQGCIDYDEFSRLLRPNTRAIVCTHGSNVTGNLLDIARIGAFAQAHGLLFLVDASQTAGAVPIDMEQMHIDVLCFTGHKGLFGPQGTGGLCIRPGVEIRPWKRGGSGIHSYDRHQPSAYPTRLEAGTLNTHGIAGLAAGMDFVQRTTVEAIGARERQLMQKLYDGVRRMEGVTVYGDFSTSDRCAIVSLNIRDYDSGRVADVLSQQYDIATRAGAHCAPRMHQALGTVEQGVVRFSLSWFNTEAEIDRALEAIGDIARL